jgi:hypothetical protein
LAIFFALTHKIQAYIAVFESIAGLRNWLPHIFIRGMRAPDEEQKIGVPGWSFGGQYCHLTGPAEVCFTKSFTAFAVRLLSDSTRE